MSARYETSGDAATVNPLIIIISGGRTPSSSSSSSSSRKQLYYVTTLSMHARAMRWEDGKPLELGRRDKVASLGPSFPIIRAWWSASLGMHTKQYL